MAIVVKDHRDYPWLYIAEHYDLSGDYAVSGFLLGRKVYTFTGEKCLSEAVEWFDRMLEQEQKESFDDSPTEIERLRASLSRVQSASTQAKRILEASDG